jgi:hypothetical protein
MPEDLTFTGRIVRQTDMAILFRADDWQSDGSDDTWLPKSQIAVIHRKGDEVEIELPEWLADDKEMF